VYRLQCTEEARLHGLTTRFYEQQKADLSTEVEALRQQLAAANEELARRADAEEGARLAAAEDNAKLNTVVRELRRRLAQVEETATQEQALEKRCADSGRGVEAIRRQSIEAIEEKARQTRGKPDATNEATIREAAAERSVGGPTRRIQTAPSNDPQCVIT